MKDYLALLGMSGLLVGTTLFVGGSALVNGQPENASKPPVATSSVGTTPAKFEVAEPTAEALPSESSAQDRERPNRRKSKSAKSNSAKQKSRLKNDSDKPDDKADTKKDEAAKDDSDQEHSKDDTKDSDAKHDGDEKEEHADEKHDDHSDDEASEKHSDAGNEKDPGNLAEVELDGEQLFAGDNNATPMTPDEMLEAPLGRLAQVIDSSDGPIPAELHGTWEVTPCHQDNEVAGTRHFDSMNLKVNSGAYYETVQFYVDEENKVLGPQTQTTYYVKVSDDHMLAVANRGTPMATYSVLKKVSSEIPEDKEEEKDEPTPAKEDDDSEHESHADEDKNEGDKHQDDESDKGEDQSDESDKDGDKKSR